MVGQCSVYTTKHGTVILARLICEAAFISVPLAIAARLVSNPRERHSAPAGGHPARLQPRHSCAYVVIRCRRWVTMLCYEHVHVSAREQNSWMSIAWPANTRDLIQLGLCEGNSLRELILRFQFGLEHFFFVRHGSLGDRAWRKNSCRALHTRRSPL